MLNTIMIITAAAAFAGFVWYRDKRPREQEPWVELLEEPLPEEAAGPADAPSDEIAANHERLPPGFVDHVLDDPKTRGPGGIDRAA